MFKEQNGKSHIVAREKVQELTEGKTISLGDAKARGELYKNMDKCQNTLQNKGSTALLESDDTFFENSEAITKCS